LRTKREADLEVLHSIVEADYTAFWQLYHFRSAEVSRPLVRTQIPPFPRQSGFTPSSL
jgi:hypothetical protein